MTPIIILNNPLPYVERIKIYEPQMKDPDTVLFFIEINDITVSMELRPDDKWKTHGTYGLFPKSIKTFIQKEIRDKFFEPKVANV